MVKILSIFSKNWVNVLVYGKSYYEKLGAKALDPYWSLFVDFVRNSPFIEFGWKRKLIDEICSSLRISSSNLTMGELSNRLYIASKQDPEHHRLWHIFYDELLAACIKTLDASDILAYIEKFSDSPSVISIASRSSKECLQRTADVHSYSVEIEGVGKMDAKRIVQMILKEEGDFYPRWQLAKFMIQNTLYFEFK